MSSEIYLSSGESDQNVSDTEKILDLSTRFPGRLWEIYKEPLKIWLLARLMDDATQANGQGSGGSGIATINIKSAAGILDRSEKTIYRWLAIAKETGLFRDYHLRQDGTVRIFYTSMRKLAKANEVNDLGSIGEIGINDIKSIRIIATELEAQEQQERSFHAATKENLEQEDSSKKYKTPLIHPEKLTNSPCELARVLGIGERFLRVSEGFVSYGASQATIAAYRRVSVRTVQRHLSNEYRLRLTEVRQKSRVDYPVIKWQLAQRLPRRFSPINHPKAGIDIGRFLRIDDRWFLLGCNIYKPHHWTVKARYQRQELISISDSKKVARGGLDHYKDG